MSKKNCKKKVNYHHFRAQPESKDPSFTIIYDEESSKCLIFLIEK